MKVSAWHTFLRRAAIEKRINENVFNNPGGARCHITGNFIINLITHRISLLVNDCKTSVQLSDPYPLNPGYILSKLHADKHGFPPVLSFQITKFCKLFGLKIMQWFQMHYSDFKWALWRLKSAATRLISLSLVGKARQTSTLGSLCKKNPLVPSWFPSQRASNVESISMPWAGSGLLQSHPGEAKWKVLII